VALAKSWSVALVGMEGHPVAVEADLATGFPGLAITGLPDTALNEARDRIKAAVANSGGTWPTSKKITIGLSPASLPKRGSGFDIALAAAVLAADAVVPASALADVVLIGELGLDGSVRGVPGVLPALLSVHDRFGGAIVSEANLAEAMLVPGLEVTAVRSLRDLVHHLRGEPREEVEAPARGAPVPPAVGDFSDVAGQPVGRLACEVAAAGGHNLLMTGAPGCGKTLLAERLPSILPPLSVQESLQVTAIHSVAGLLPAESLISHAPFQAPHHSSSQAALIGGGSGVAKPGAASLAHRGVLFLDEAPEFKTGVLDALRQPLESGEIRISRVQGVAVYPARFALVLAANPCPCARTESACSCTPERRRSYFSRMSGPLLDRLDISVEMNAITRADVMDDQKGESSELLAGRVARARAAAVRRFAGTPYRRNADVPPTDLVRHWPLSRAALEPIGKAMDDGLLTARGFGRVQRLAWTVADLAGHPEPATFHAQVALSLRLGDRLAPRSWAA
jgi:magnesium chelatase family protein